MTRRLIPLLTALTLAMFADAGHASGKHTDPIGKPGIPAQARRTVQIDMSDAMRFTPSSIDVKQGETVRFVVKNSGQLQHEMVLGTEKDLKRHDELMRKHPGMEHADAHMVSVAPGQTGEIVWQFTQAGRIDFACLQAGHFDAGMRGVLRVTGKDAALREDGHADHKH